MRNKIIGWSIVGLAFLICLAGIRSDNLSRQFRTDIAYCNDVRTEPKSEAIIAFCEKIAHEVATRNKAAEDYRIYYLTKRAKESS